MNIKRIIYIFLLMLPVIITGCTDEFFGPDNDSGLDPNVVSFSVSASGEETTTRGMETTPLYEPLELRGEADEQILYLHTYDSPRIGYIPGEHQSVQSTRGMQVDNADDLQKFHTDFMVHAALYEDLSEYIEWVKCIPSSSGSNIWRTEKTRYWPSNEMLAFHAISPSSEFTNLKNRISSPNSLSFSYSVYKGNTDKDAEMQQDLLIAAGSCNKAGSIDGRAPLKFHHALSAVKFAVRDVLGGEVVNICISGIHGSGDCRYETDPESGAGEFKWSNLGETQTYSQNFNHRIDDRIVDPADDTQDILLNDRMPEKTFMLIPQRIPDDAEIIVTLKRDGMNPEQITVRGKIKANNVTEWKPGHEYVYTISTSKDNWVYVLTATGNHDTLTRAHGSIENHDVNGNQIYVYSPSEDEHDEHGDTAYFKVRSFRYRANNPSYIEDLPWKAEHNDARQYQISGNEDKYVTNRDIPAAEWIKDPLMFKGSGSHDVNGECHDILFTAHHHMTDWPGDKWMQDESSYSGNSESNPWDLSTCGGKLSQNTANCYVIDREGWYIFPLVYGNSIENGDKNEDAYIFKGTKYSALSHGYTYLDVFKRHDGNNIDGPYIPESFCKSAQLVWTDVYNCVSDISVIETDGKRYIKFHANKYNLQQGSAVIALYDNDDPEKGTVTWSWHIWITEHWLNPANGQPNAYDENATVFTQFNPAEKSKRRNRGDLYLSSWRLSYFHYYISPYNLGWCDPKNVDYLRRPGTMEFTQYRADEVTKTGKTVRLPILQDGAHIEYKFGNNTYYQFGRKDAIVGFVDHDSNVKRNFGPKQYELDSQYKTLSEAIKAPNTLYCQGIASQNDWCGTNYVNTWNNNTESLFYVDPQDGTPSSVDHNSFFHSLKTVYDPCPPGYMVPPASVWKIVGASAAGTYNDISFKDSDVSDNYNGVKGNDDYTFIIWASTTAVKDDNNKVWLTSTGHRWYNNAGTLTQNGHTVMGGDNFNAHLVYLWSSTPTGRNDGGAFSLALGKDATGWGVCPLFYGRRAMARPVRPIRQVYTRPQ